MDIAGFLISGIRIIAGLFLLLFLPGFFMSLIFYPRFEDLRIQERLVFSVVLSLGGVMTVILFTDIFLGIDSTPQNIILIISICSVFFALIWILQRMALSFSLSEKVSDQMEGISKRLGYGSPLKYPLRKKVTGFLGKFRKHNK